MSTVLSAKVSRDSITLTIPADTPEEQVHFHRVQKFRPLRRKGQGTTYKSVKQGRSQHWAPVGYAGSHIWISGNKIIPLNTWKSFEICSFVVVVLLQFLFQK